MPACRFDLGVTALVFSVNPARPSRGFSVFQPDARSTGGVPFGFDPHARERRWALSFRGMPADDRAALETFFRNVAKGMSETFTATFPDGSSATVRFAVESLDFTEHAAGRFAVDVPLLEA